MKDPGKGSTDEGVEWDKGYVDKGKEKGRMNCRKSVFLNSENYDKIGKGYERRLGDQRWIHRQHGAYQGAVGEDLEVCPLQSTSKKRRATNWSHTLLLSSIFRHVIITIYPQGSFILLKLLLAFIGLSFTKCAGHLPLNTNQCICLVTYDIR